MRLPIRSVLAALALGLLAAAPARAAPTAADCAPGAPCAHPLPVRVVIVSMFEVGADTGDTPGEFQLWKERRKLDTRIALPNAWHDLWYNPETQVLGMVTGVGSFKAAASVTAVGLDPRLDLSKAYWLVAGIAGVDPESASIGSAAWAKYVVDGDLAHEIDPREMPSDWKSGRFPLDSQGPDYTAPAKPRGELFTLNPALEAWAYALTKDVTPPDDPDIAAERARFTGYPKAQRAPFVLEGDELSAITFWHGRLLNDWANDWVRYWTGGKGEFVMSAEEDSGTIQAIDYLSRIGKVDKDRLMVLRAGSNFTMPPPGVDAATYLLRENEGYSGMRASLESLYAVGSVVIDELLAHWDKYRDTPPK